MVHFIWWHTVWAKKHPVSFQQILKASVAFPKNFKNFNLKSFKKLDRIWWKLLLLTCRMMSQWERQRESLCRNLASPETPSRLSMVWWKHLSSGCHQLAVVESWSFVRSRRDTVLWCLNLHRWLFTFTLMHYLKLPSPAQECSKRMEITKGNNQQFKTYRHNRLSQYFARTWTTLGLHARIDGGFLSCIPYDFWKHWASTVYATWTLALYLTRSKEGIFNFKETAILEIDCRRSIFICKWLGSASRVPSGTLFRWQVLKAWLEVSTCILHPLNHA